MKPAPSRPQPSTRRGFLRGTGVCLGLPWLPSFFRGAVGAENQTEKAPVRSVFLHFPNGVWEQAWVPQSTGRNYELSPSLIPLAAVKSDVLVCTGLDKKHSHDGDGHYAKTANFLTGLTVRRTAGKDISAGGISVDQLMAQVTSKETPLPSLVLGIYPVMTGVDRSVGYTHAYGSYISWESESRPVTPEINPRVVYESMFRPTQEAKSRKGGSSLYLLDYVLDDARNLRHRLGRDDQHKMDEYLDSVRAIENRLKFSAQNPDWKQRSALSEDEILAAKPGQVTDFRDHINIMMDLIVLAFRTDMTRVATLMLATGLSNQSFAFIDGVKGEHHELSHHENNPDKIAQYQKINQWYVGQFVAFIERLKATPEAQGTLLDNCMVLFGSGMSDGNRHDPDNLPILLAGRAGGSLKPGEHIAASSGSVPLCNLYLSMLDRMGVKLDRFGDSTGRLLPSV